MSDTRQQSGALVKVNFLGDVLEVFKEGNNAMVAIHPVCTGIGIDYKSQLKRLHRSPWATIAMMKTVAQDGKIRQLCCVDLETLAMWLATIEASRCNADVQPKLIKYQKLCKRAISNALFGEVRVEPVDGLQQTEVFKRILDLISGLADVVSTLRPQVDEIRARVGKMDEDERQAIYDSAYEEAHRTFKDIAAGRAPSAPPLPDQERERIVNKILNDAAEQERAKGLEEEAKVRDGNLSAWGLTVEEGMTEPTREGKKPRKIWQVTGTTKEIAPIMKQAGGQWYRQRGCWSFYADPQPVLGFLLQRQGDA